MMRNEARLDVFKALGDNTRYAIYLELARSAQPLATAEIALTLGLHINTVRPHLERMRDAGLLEVKSKRRVVSGGRNIATRSRPMRLRSGWSRRFFRCRKSVRVPLHTNRG